MSPTALLLVTAAGLLHALWNLVLKRASSRLPVTAWALLAGAAVFSPALVRAWPPPPQAWPFACASALVLLAYYACLARAYERGDFSLIYPLARGAAPAMLALWAIVFMGERPSALGYLGILSILAGLAVLGAAPLWHMRRSTSEVAATLRRHARGSGIALLVAFLVSVYSALDGAAVRHWEPVPYLVLTFGLAGALLVPLLAMREGKHLFRVLRTHWVPVALIAVMMLGAYSLVLRAFQIAPISYAGAGREIGIVFGAMAGWLVLGERFGGVRTAGAALVFAGILALAVAE